MVMPAGKRWDDRIGRRLKPRDLHILMSVVQHGSMGKAARELAISQSAISKAIADLEHCLGVRLLDRTAQGVEPTAYGRSLTKWGTTVFDDLSQAIKEIDFLADPTAGEVRIGSMEITLAGLVPAVIDRLSRLYPRIVFKVASEPNFPLQYRDLRERKVDLILGRIVTPVLDDDLNVEILFDEPINVAAGTNSKWQRRRKIDVVELMDERWLFPPSGGMIIPLIAKSFRAKGLDLPRHTVETNSIQLLAAMLATGRFLAMVSNSTLRLSGERLGMKALPVDLPLPSAPVAIVTLKHRTLTPVAQRFIECAREISRPLAR